VSYLRAALAAGGAGPEHVVKRNLLVVEGEPLEAGFSAFRHAWGNPPSPQAITMAFVAGLANPDYPSQRHPRQCWPAARRGRS
jgi:hypothetical protein